ncbi:hypothetical protein SLE2022_033300 [Rubroshorea leprosula]
MTNPESLHFRRYAELMGAIVDTAEDLRLLRDFKVLEVNEKYHMSDAVILEIFNGMTGTMRSKDATIDEQIEETNKCYNKYPVVRMKRAIKKYVYSSWKFCCAFCYAATDSDDGFTNVLRCLWLPYCLLHGQKSLSFSTRNTLFYLSLAIISLLNNQPRVNVYVG